MTKEECLEIIKTAREKGITVDLSCADLSSADLSGADLSYADLSCADLSSADLRDANLSSADLRGADLSSANLSGADLINADLSRADLRYADLRGANLSNAGLRGANLRYADLRGADLNGVLLDKPIILTTLHKHSLQFNFNINELRIGCLVKSFDDFIDQLDTMGKENNYSTDDIEKYRMVITSIIDTYGDK